MCEDCYDVPTPLTAAEKRRRAILRIPAIRASQRAYYKAHSRAKCIASILHGDAVIFGATVRGGKIAAGALYANRGVGDLTVAESTIDRCEITATQTRVGFYSQITSNYLRRPGEQSNGEDPIQLVR